MITQKKAAHTSVKYESIMLGSDCLIMFQNIKKRKKHILTIKMKMQGFSN